jgi:hypothetical protein
MSESPAHPSISGQAVEAGLRAALIDRITVEVSEAFRARGIPSIVLKGPAIANWLYGPDELRAYGDSDLLVPQSLWTRAQHVLRDLGFVNGLEQMAHPRMESYSSDAWGRRDGDVDLHSTIYGLDADMTSVWRVLSGCTEPMRIAGVALPVLAPPARAMHLALHAAQHQDGKAIYDLEKAIAQLPEDIWWAAAEVAATLRGLPAFAAGLRLVEGGAALAERMGVARFRSPNVELRSGRVPLSESLYELLETPGLRAKMRFARAEVFPTPTFMRWWSPLARRSRAGLIAAYIWRPLYLMIRSPAAIAAVWRARGTPRSSREAGFRRPD